MISISLKEVLNIIFMVFIIYIVICILWQNAELLIYGERTYRVLDDIVALILSFSLTFNFFDL
ncbi:hypothetical protein [Virgibacillus salexigens]|uniref:Uncharacterized protein n=1 Tax=Virgibacillus massiliensis TaxID=1462526 RepID=A0A024QJ14_9BACI|nr:hypothetical protein [Virgibacillus massiliensis]CDQ41936.1 hypothetical protein BN990_04315 [Virgibacillus massiliensis]